MRDLNKYGIKCINEMKEMGVDIDTLPTINWVVNNRAKHRFGRDNRPHTWQSYLVIQKSYQISKDISFFSFFF